VFSWSSHIKEHRARARPSQPDGTPERRKPTTVSYPGIYQTLTEQLRARRPAAPARVALFRARELAVTGEQSRGPVRVI
jgi:hypothetical protein